MESLNVKIEARMCYFCLFIDSLEKFNPFLKTEGFNLMIVFILVIGIFISANFHDHFYKEKGIFLNISITSLFN